MAIHVDFTSDNSNAIQSIDEIEGRFAQLKQFIKKQDFGEGFSKQLKLINDYVDKMMDEIEKSITKTQAEIDGLIRERNSALANGSTQNVGELSLKIDGLVKQRTELLKNLDTLRGYKDEVVKACEASEAFEDRQEKKRAALAKVGSVLGTVAGVGFKGLIASVKAFMSIGIVGVVNAISTAFMSLMKYLKGTEDGQMALAKISGYLQGLFTSLKGTAIQVGKALFNAFSTLKPVIEGVVNRLAALVSVVNSLIKMGGAAVRGQWEEVSKEYEAMKGGLKAIWTGDLGSSEASQQAKELGEAYRDLYAQRQKLQNQKDNWAEEKAGLELEIAKANASKDYAKAKELEQKISKKDLDLLNQEYDIEKSIVDLKGDTKTTSDDDKLRDLRIAKTQMEAAQIQKDARTDTKAESAEQKRQRLAEKALREEEQRLKKEEELQNELNSLLLANEDARLELMETGTKKEIEQLRQRYDKRNEELRKQEEKWKRENREAKRTGLGDDGLTTEQRTALTTARGYNEASREKAANEIARKNREQYLKDYGTYEEKKLAINQDYVRKMLATDDEYERKSLSKERERNLQNLERQYNATYSLIFADADMLSDTLLSKAIKITQEEIVKAEKEGDIQTLTDLYSNLRRQLTEKSNRGGSWGFIGLANALKDIEGARKDAENASDPQKRSHALAMEQTALANVRKRATEVQEVFTGIGSVLEGMEGTLGEIGSGVSALGGAAKSVVEAMAQFNTGKGFSPGQVISTAFTSAIQLGAMVVGSIRANKEAQDDWNRSIVQSQHELEMLNLEALDYKEQNIFGVENPYKAAIDGARQYSEAMRLLQEQISKLNKGKVQTDTKKAVNWANVGKGAAAGAAAGAIAGGGAFSWLTTGIGAAIGAVAGLVSTKVVPVFESLTKKYGTIVNDDLSLNPQLLADYDKLDDDTKQLVDNWEEIRKKAKEAEDQMRETFSSLAGDLGTQLSDSLVGAFKNGKLDSAIDDFHDKMNDTIENIVEQMIFSNVFSGMFDDLQKEMEKSFGAGGDNNIVDDLIRFEEAYKSGLETYGQQMEEARAYLKSSGYDKAFTSEEQRTASSRSSLGASQDSIDESNGRLTAIQGQVFQMNETVLSFSEKYERLITTTASVLEHTQGIHIDTTELKGMVSEMRELSRAVSRNVSTITDKGVIMRQ